MPCFILYSDDAPALEHELHQLFKARRLNSVNARREFFQDVALGEIENFVKNKGLSAQFLSVPEAREYRQTLAMRQRTPQDEDGPEKRFPDQLFAASA
jgi:hypothetical protein